MGRQEAALFFPSNNDKGVHAVSLAIAGAYDCHCYLSPLQQAELEARLLAGQGNFAIAKMSATARIAILNRPRSLEPYHR